MELRLIEGLKNKSSNGWIPLDWVVLNADRGERIALACRHGVSHIDTRDLPSIDGKITPVDLITLESAMKLNQALLASSIGSLKHYRLCLAECLPALDRNTVNFMMAMIELPRQREVMQDEAAERKKAG